MINQEEYEILKGLDDKWKWIARHGVENKLNVYELRPIKSAFVEWWFTNKWSGFSKIVPIDLFQFIQWEDEEPHYIPDLISDYEGSVEYTFYKVNEAFSRAAEAIGNKLEGEEVKDIEWAKKEVKELMTEESQNYPHDEMVEKEIVLGILNQLDEPESIKQFDEESFRDWITINLMSANVLTYSMRSAEMSGDELEDFLVNAVKESLYEESEETEMKSKRELIEKWESAIEAAEFYGKGKEERLISYMKDFVSDLNQLDEPEVLSEEWIENKKWQAYDPDARTLYWAVTETDLQNLLVPKQELPEIPEYVAEWIDEIKPNKSLRVAFEYIAQRKRKNHDDKLAFWVEEGNSETFARAWLDGFTVEGEQKYYVYLGDGQYLVSGDDLKEPHAKIRHQEDRGFLNYNTTFTEQEIKDYDERYLAFKEPVEELGE